MKKPYQIMGGEDGYEIMVDGVLTDAVYPKDNKKISIARVRKVAAEAIRFVDEDGDSPAFVQTLSIGPDVEEIEPGAFANLEEVDSVVVDANNAHYKAVDNVIFTKDGKKLIYFPANKRGSYTVPEGTETIVYKAFYFSCLKSITLPESLSVIEDYAFMESDIEEVRGVPGSYAEEFAASEGFLFVDTAADEGDNARSSSKRRLVNVVLVDGGENRLEVIKLLKQLCGMGMAEAKAAIDSAPSVIKSGVNIDTARLIVYYSKESGAKMKIE